MRFSGGGVIEGSVKGSFRGATTRVTRLETGVSGGFSSDYGLFSNYVQNLKNGRN